MIKLPSPDDPNWLDRAMQLVEQLYVDVERLQKNRTDVFPQSWFGLVPPVGGCFCIGEDPLVNRWTFPLTGVTNSTGCANCASANAPLGGWEVNRVNQDTCQWVGAFTVVCQQQCRWELSHVSGSWTLQLGNPALVTYTLADDSFNCASANVMDFSSSNACNNWPATITLSPG